MIHTVTGAIERTDFGTVLMHEHISCTSLPFINAFGTSWLDKTRLEALGKRQIASTFRASI